MRGVLCECMYKCMRASAWTSACVHVCESEYPVVIDRDVFELPGGALRRVTTKNEECVIQNERQQRKRIYYSITWEPYRQEWCTLNT